MSHATESDRWSRWGGRAAQVSALTVGLLASGCGRALRLDEATVINVCTATGVHLVTHTQCPTVRDLVALGYMSGRGVLPFESEIKIFCEESRVVVVSREHRCTFGRAG